MYYSFKNRDSGVTIDVAEQSCEKNIDEASKPCRNLFAIFCLSPLVTSKMALLINKSPGALCITSLMYSGSLSPVAKGL